MARQSRRMAWRAGELNLTAMIDVAFQLLAFFIIAAHPVNVFTNLELLRPQPIQAVAPPPPPDMPILEIMVSRDGYALQKQKVDLAEIDRQLTKLARFSRIPLVIKCTGDSSHAGLVNVLDLCAKTGFTQISVFSM